MPDFCHMDFLYACHIKSLTVTSVAKQQTYCIACTQTVVFSMRVSFKLALICTNQPAFISVSFIDFNGQFKEYLLFASLYLCENSAKIFLHVTSNKQKGQILRNQIRFASVPDYISNKCSPCLLLRVHEYALHWMTSIMLILQYCTSEYNAQYERH